MQEKWLLEAGNEQGAIPATKYRMRDDEHIRSLKMNGPGNLAEIFTPKVLKALKKRKPKKAKKP